MIKTILYTSNPDVKVNSLEDVEDFAAAEGKYYSCIAKKGTELYGLKEGAHVLTQKGNNVYVLEVVEGAEEFDGAKKSNITGIVSIDYPFGEPDEDLFEGLKDSFSFNKVDDVKFSINGQLCVRTANGYVTITETNELVRYPKSMVLDVPVYTMPKAKSALVAGDTMVVGNSYAKVVKIANNKVITVSYKGTGKTVYPIKDFLMNEAYVQVVVSPMSNMMAPQGAQAGNQIGFNPMILALAGKDSDDLLPLAMMQGGQNINPAMLLMMNKSNKKKKKADESNSVVKTMLMMQAFGGGNAFGGMFGMPQQAPVANHVKGNDDNVEDEVPANAEIEE